MAAKHYKEANKPLPDITDMTRPFWTAAKNGKLVLTRWQSNDCLNFASMIYAYGQDNIALTGEDWTSRLNGQGGVPFQGSTDCWWTWKGKNRTINPASQANTPGYVEGKLTQRLPNPINPKSLKEVAPQMKLMQAK